jgi:type VI secretion system secreted protein Hcp
MAIPAYMKIDGIPGSVTVTGREGSIEILEFDHAVYIPIDRDDGSISGTRKHGAVTLHKAFDKSSAELYKRVCTGKEIPQIEIEWYEITPLGEEECYYTHTLKGCKISSVRSYMHNVKDPTKETFVHQEEICLRYEDITWTFKEGNLKHTDTWKVRKGS